MFKQHFKWRLAAFIFHSHICKPKEMRMRRTYMFSSNLNLLTPSWKNISLQIFTFFSRHHIKDGHVRKQISASSKLKFRALSSQLPTSVRRESHAGPVLSPLASGCHVCHLLRVLSSSHQLNLAELSGSEVSFLLCVTCDNCGNSDRVLWNCFKVLWLKATNGLCGEIVLSNGISAFNDAENRRICCRTRVGAKIRYACFYVC